MRYPQLDERLQAAADLFPACERGADIGADHGRLSCYLLHSGKCRHMLVSDISADSLAKAQRLLTLHGLDHQSEFAVADGLNVLREYGPVQCAAICGMGGRLVAQILQQGQSLLQDAALVLSSHTDIPLVRQTLMQMDYAIVDERIVHAKGRFYVLMRAEAGKAHYTARELYLGPRLLAGNQPLWHQYLCWREGVVACEAGHDEQLAWIREELAK